MRFERCKLDTGVGVETLKDALVNQQRQSCLQPPHFQLRADLCLSEKLIESFPPFCSISKIHTLGLLAILFPLRPPIFILH